MPKLDRNPGRASYDLTPGQSPHLAAPRSGGGQTDQTLEQAVEALLRAWVSGRLKIVSDKAGPRPE